jgi:hypothetical protein
MDCNLTREVKGKAAQQNGLTFFFSCPQGKGISLLLVGLGSL